MRYHLVVVATCVFALLAGGCSGAKHDAAPAEGYSAPPDDYGDYTEPEFPERVEPGSEYADNCEEGPEGTCRVFVRYGCAGGGTCGGEIPCDPSLCKPRPAAGSPDTSSTGTQ